MNLKSLILGIIAGLIAIALILGFVHLGSAHGYSEDNVPGNECEEGIHLFNPHCIISPLPSLTPTNVQECESEDCVEVTVTPTPQEQVTATPSRHQENDNQGGAGDNQSDHRSDNLGCGSHDCNTHTDVPKAPAAGFDPRN